MDECIRQRIDAMNTIAGFDIRTRCRRTAYTAARYIVADDLKRLGYTECTIADAINLHHTTVNRCKEWVQDLLDYPQGRIEAMELYREYHNKLNDMPIN